MRKSNSRNHGIVPVPSHSGLPGLSVLSASEHRLLERLLNASLHAEAVPDTDDPSCRNDIPVEPIVEGRACPATRRLHALHRFTVAILRSHGHPSIHELRTFLAAGFGRDGVMEVMHEVSLRVVDVATGEFVVGVPDRVPDDR